MAGAERGFNNQGSYQAYRSYQTASHPYQNEHPNVSPIEASDSPFGSASVSAPASQSIPQPPPFRQRTEPSYDQNPSPEGQYGRYSPSGVTPAADNLSNNAVGGGINGLAYDVANAHERESGVQALRDISNWGSNGNGIAGPRSQEPDIGHSNTPQPHYGHPLPAPPSHAQQQAPYPAVPPQTGGLAPLAPTPSTSTHTSERSFPVRTTPPQAGAPYQDGPYNRYSSSNLDITPQMGINPDELEDDDDWGVGPTHPQPPKRRSLNPFSSTNASRVSTPGGSPGAAGVAAGAGAAGVLGMRDHSGQYNAVPQGPSPNAAQVEKSEWLDHQQTRNKRLKWIVGTLIVLIIIGGIVGGVLGGILGKKKDGGVRVHKTTPQSVAEDNKNDLDKDDKEIQALLNNKDLHKVFPGMDYTPLNAQYPDCMHMPPSQNNVTRDIAVISQLTNAVRLYGTDCNQTEMVLHAIDRLDLKDMKVWLGVWIGNNDTTNERQLDQMWAVLDKYDHDRFKGVIVGNEVLFRKDKTALQLGKIISDVKSNMTAHGIKLPVATSDLGDNWTADLAVQVDIVMSNIHPFFAGVTADKAAGWTWDFWTGHDVLLTKNMPNIKHIISEVGWPSAGGNNCGQSTCGSTTEGSIAGVAEMNTFMENWVCQSMDNGTEYFWFETFDEPWKITFNEPGKEWEDKWGLMDINRKLKPGVTIPDCGGRTPP